MADESTKFVWVKKPVTVEAFKWLGQSETDRNDIPGWFLETLLWSQKPGRAPTPISFDGECVVIETLEGDMRCEPGNWIVRGVKGELYPVKDEIFHELHERAMVFGVPVKPKGIPTEGVFVDGE